VAAGVTVKENQLALPFAAAFAGMTPVTIGFTPAAGPAAWDARVTAKPGADAHCTLLAPVFLTAQEGDVQPPVFDSLSPDTAGEKVEWDMDQNTATADPSCACPTPGSPITPVRVDWGVGATPGTAPATPVTLPAASTGLEALPPSAKGEFFSIRARL